LVNITRVKYLSDLRPDNKNEYSFTIETNNEEIKLLVGENNIDKNMVYWTSLDNKNFFEISKSDFDVLTGKLY
jgi:hypothetical protein